MPQRIMLKVSGEELGGEDLNFDNTQAARISEIIESLVVSGYHVACVMGGGNIVRGEKLAKRGFQNQVIADHMGMLATIQNGLFLNETLLARGKVTSVLLSNIESTTIAERFSYRRANTLLDSGCVVLIGGGLGKPGFTTDTGAVTQAFELHCEIVVKTTKVDGIYSADPATNPDATRFGHLSYEEALSNPAINVMDKTALAFAAGKKLKLIVCLSDSEQLKTVLSGDTSNFGTIVS